MSLWAPGLWATGLWAEGLWYELAGPPVITDQPDDASAIVGQTATFSVAAAGAISYQWEVQTGGVGAWASVTTGAGGTSASYTTAALALADSGNRYRVVVTNPDGSTTSDSAGLTVAERARGGSRRNYIIKGRRYYNVTNEELAYLIARDLIDLTREDIRVSYQDQPARKISRGDFAKVVKQAKKVEPEFDDDEESAAMLLL